VVEREWLDAVGGFPQPRCAYCCVGCLPFKAELRGERLSAWLPSGRPAPTRATSCVKDVRSSDTQRIRTGAFAPMGSRETINRPVGARSSGERGDRHRPAARCWRSSSGYGTGAICEDHRRPAVARTKEVLRRLRKMVRAPL